MIMKLSVTSYDINNVINDSGFWRKSSNYPCIGIYKRDSVKFAVLFFEASRGIVISKSLECEHNLGLYLSEWSMDLFTPVTDKEVSITLTIK